MAGTLEVPVEGNAVATEDPKVKAAIKRLNELLEASNLIEAGGIGTAQVTSTKLAASAKELFPQLATAAARKVNFGESTVEFEAAKVESKVREITHSLGAKPVFVGLTLEAVTGATVIGLRTTERTSTVFKVFANATSAPGAVSLTFAWVAIG